MRYILGIDPSGSFHEGKGTTGLAVLDSVKNKIIYTGYIFANNFGSQEEYFQAHLQWILDSVQRYDRDCVISLEDYVIYSTHARSHINTHCETSQLIGLLKWFIWTINIKLNMRPAAAVMNRFSNKILEHAGYIYQEKGRWYTPGKDTPLYEHEIDAIRHCVYCYKFDLAEKKKIIAKANPSNKKPKKSYKQHREYYGKLLRDFNDSSRNHYTLKHTGDYATSQRFAAALRGIIKRSGYDMIVTQRGDDIFVSKH